MRAHSLVLLSVAAACGCADPGSLASTRRALDGDPVNLYAYNAVPRFAQLGGDDLELGFGFYNSGWPTNAVNVVARIEITGQFAPIGGVADPIDGCDLVEAPGQAIYACRWPELAAENGVWIRLFLHPTAAGPIQVRSSIASDTPEADPGDNVRESTIEVFAETVADLEIFRGKVKRPPIGGGRLDDLPIGHLAYPRFFATNYGPSTSSSSQVVVTVTGPAHFTAALSEGCTLESETRMNCTYGPLAPWDYLPAPSVEMLPTAVGEVVVTATLTGGDRDPDLANNQATIRFTTFVPRHADVAVTTVATSRRNLYREPVTYTMTVKNLGPDQADDVRLQHWGDWSFANRSFTTPQGSCAMDSAGLDCSLGPIAAGASVDVVLVTEPSLGGTFGDYTYAANWAPRTLDLDRANNVYNSSITLRGPNPPISVNTAHEWVGIEAFNWVDCAAEGVLLTGEARQLVHYQIDQNRQSGRFRYQLNFIDVTGLGSESGRRYRAVGGWSDASAWIPLGPSAYRTTSHFGLISDGGGPNLVGHTTLLHRYDADGNLVTSVERSWTTCR